MVGFTGLQRGGCRVTSASQDNDPTDGRPQCLLWRFQRRNSQGGMKTLHPNKHLEAFRLCYRPRLQGLTASSPMGGGALVPDLPALSMHCIATGIFGPVSTPPINPILCRNDWLTTTIVALMTCRYIGDIASRFTPLEEALSEAAVRICCLQEYALWGAQSSPIPAITSTEPTCK
jgi:hypothetical protein